jgi:HPt (histidine-containing phosphotransfer) domain-containing protein
MQDTPSTSGQEALLKLSAQLSVPMDTLRSVLEIFYNEYKNFPDRTATFIQNNDWPALLSSVHKFKGASGSLQMHNLRAQLVELEIKLKQGETVSVKDLQPLYQEMQHVINCYQLASLSTHSAL